MQLVACHDQLLFVCICLTAAATAWTAYQEQLYHEVLPCTLQHKAGRHAERLIAYDFCCCAMSLLAVLSLFLITVRISIVSSLVLSSSSLVPMIVTDCWYRFRSLSTDCNICTCTCHKSLNIQLLSPERHNAIRLPLCQ